MGVSGRRRGWFMAAPLTTTEVDVLDRIGRGHEVTAIATARQMTTAQVKTTLRNARRKLGARNNAHAIALAYRAGALPNGGTA